MSNELQIQSNKGFMIIDNLQDAIKISEIIAKSSFCPKAFLGKPGDVLVCAQFGAELGLQFMQSLQNIAVINGRPSLWGDAMLALCQQSPNYEYIEETFDDATMTATCKAKRKGSPEAIVTFSKDDAQKAGLWGKQGPWSQYAGRMLKLRARGFALRDTFADCLKGLISAEEANDYSKPKEKIVQSEPVNIEGEELISPQEVTQLAELAIAADVKIDEMCKKLKVESLHFITKTMLPKVIKKLNVTIEHAEHYSEAKEVFKEFFEGEKNETIIS